LCVLPLSGMASEKQEKEKRKYSKDSSTHDVKAEEEATARRRRKRSRRTRPEDEKADVASEQVPLEKKSVNNSIRKCQKNSSSSSSR
jgi:hypothetical protein